MPPEGSVGKHSALQVREKLRTEFLPSPKLGVLLGAGDLTPGLTRPLPACLTPWKAAISDSTFALFLTKFLLGLGASEMGSSDEGRWVLPATVILEAQMKDSSGRPGPTVIRAVGPQPTAGMGLTNPLPMTRQSSLCPDTFITPTADTAVLGHHPPSVVVVRGAGLSGGRRNSLLGKFCHCSNHFSTGELWGQGEPHHSPAMWLWPVTSPLWNLSVLHATWRPGLPSIRCAVK